MAQLFGYEKVNGVWYASYTNDGNDENDVKVSGIINILGPDTKVKDFDARLEEMFDNDGVDDATIGQFMDAGIVDLSSSEAALNMLNGGSDSWKDRSVSGFINWIVSLATRVQP